MKNSTMTNEDLEAFLVRLEEQMYEMDREHHRRHDLIEENIGVFIDELGDHLEGVSIFLEGMGGFVGRILRDLFDNYALTKDQAVAAFSKIATDESIEDFKAILKDAVKERKKKEN